MRSRIAEYIARKLYEGMSYNKQTQLSNENVYEEPSEYVQHTAKKDITLLAVKVFSGMRVVVKHMLVFHLYNILK